jgi:tetratricopeptide (TPR) repeat protein
MDDKTKLVAMRCARVYFSTKAWKKAIGEYEILYRDFPDDPFVVEPLAKCYYEDGQMYRAKDLYEKVRELYAKKGDTAKTERLQNDINKMFGGGGAAAPATGTPPDPKPPTTPGTPPVI